MTEEHTIDREEVMALADGELAADRAIVVRAHLEECDACRAFAESLTRTSAAMAAWRIPAAPASLDARVLADVGRTSPAAGENVWTRLRAWLVPGPAPWIAAAAAAVLIVGVIGPRLWPTTPAPASTMADARKPGEPEALPFSATAPGVASSGSSTPVGQNEARPVGAVPPAVAAVPDRARPSEPKKTTSAETERRAANAPTAPAPVATGVAAGVPVGAAGAPLGATVPPAPPAAIGGVAPPPPPPQAPAVVPPAAAAPVPPAPAGLGRPAPARGLGARAGGRGGGDAAIAPRQEAAAGTFADRLAEAPLPARRASLTILAERFGDVRIALERIVTTHGAEIAAYAASTVGADQRRIAATIRVAPDRLDAALDALRRLGTVRDEAVATDDLRSARLDLATRLASSQAEEVRLRNLLARSPAVRDALAVEAQIARARAEISRLEDEQRALADRIARATIVLQFDER